MVQLSETVRYEVDEGLAILTTANPPLNLYGAATSRGLMDGIERAVGEGARAILYRAEGKFFSAGVDVNNFQAAVDGVLGSNGAAGATKLVSQCFEDAPIPTIAAVHALCLTAAFEAALGCDFIIAAESAKFGLIESTIGLTPLAGGTQRIALRAGPIRAYEVAMTGERFDAATFERWNIINRVLPDATFEADALAFAKRLAAGPTLALGVTKQVVHAYLSGGLPMADSVMPALTAPLRSTEDHKSALKSFFANGPGKATFVGCDASLRDASLGARLIVRGAAGPLSLSV